MTTRKKTTSLTQEELRKRLHMVQGQIEGIITMCDEGKDCVDVLTQFKAARAGLEKVLSLYLEDNLRQCVVMGKRKGKQELETIISGLIS
ncbi:MAG TPA: metal-sensitive transcriptional regulator [Candidatus Paceibacterota bacterium]